MYHTYCYLDPNKKGNYIYQSMIRNGFAYGYKWKYYE